MVDGWVVFIRFVFLHGMSIWGDGKKGEGRKLTPGVVGSVIPLGCKEVLGRVQLLALVGVDGGAVLRSLSWFGV